MIGRNLAANAWLLLATLVAASCKTTAPVSTVAAVTAIDTSAMVGGREAQRGEMRQVKRAEGWITKGNSPRSYSRFSGVWLDRHTFFTAGHAVAPFYHSKLPFDQLRIGGGVDGREQERSFSASELRADVPASFRKWMFEVLPKGKTPPTVESDLGVIVFPSDVARPEDVLRLATAPLEIGDRLILAGHGEVPSTVTGRPRYYEKMYVGENSVVSLNEEFSHMVTISRAEAMGKFTLGSAIPDSGDSGSIVWRPTAAYREAPFDELVRTEGALEAVAMVSAAEDNFLNGGERRGFLVNLGGLKGADLEWLQKYAPDFRPEGYPASQPVSDGRAASADAADERRERQEGAEQDKGNSDARRSGGR